MLIQFACVSFPIFAGVINDRHPVCVSLFFLGAICDMLLVYLQAEFIVFPTAGALSLMQTIDPNDRLKIA